MVAQPFIDNKGINRNIVECKGLGQGATASTGKVLIETSWNVKIKPIPPLSK